MARLVAHALELPPSTLSQVDGAFLHSKVGLPADVAEALAAGLSLHAAAAEALVATLEAEIRGSWSFGGGKSNRASLAAYSSVTTTTLDFRPEHQYSKHSVTTRSSTTYQFGASYRPTTWVGGSNESSEAGGYLVTGPGDLLMISNEGYFQLYQVQVSLTELVLNSGKADFRYWRN